LQGSDDSASVRGLTFQSHTTVRGLSIKSVVFFCFDDRILWHCLIVWRKSPKKGAAKVLLMLSKRHTEIMRMLTDEGTVTISELAARLGVSLETVRRDVRPLTENGSVLKIHGAVGLAGQVGEAPFQRRMRENADAKRRIAREMAGLIQDGDSVMLDTGTTTSLWPGNCSGTAAHGGHQFIRHRADTGNDQWQQGLYGGR
jgi:DNA-binding transcriptional ArsR family regulator